MQNELINQNASVGERDITVITQEIHELCRQAKTMLLMYAVEIGRRLVEAKAVLPHGAWGTWIKENTEFSQSTANNYMKLFDEYGASQITIFGATVNSQSLANLPYSKALALLAVDSEEREEFAEKVGADELSVKELEAAIAERDAAKKRAEELEEKNTELERARVQAEEAAGVADALKEQISELEGKLLAEQEATKKAKDSLKKAKENPKIPPEKLEAIKKEAEDTAKREFEESAGKELAELKEQLKAAEEAKAKADKDKAEAEKNLAEAEKKLKTASPEVNAFKVMFVAFQEAGNKCRKQIEIIREGDPETAGKDKIIKNKNQTRLHEFCRHYVYEELKHSKMEVLAVVGFNYEDYLKRWLGMDKEAVKALPDLTKSQKKAIIKANAIRPIRLTPEMIMRRSRGHARRSPLGMNPETKKGINFGVKFVTSLITSAFISIIVIDIVIEPTWLMFVSGMLKVVAVIHNDALLPLYLKKYKDADSWLETRAIDSHRANSRLLKKALRLENKDDISTVIHVNAATITDNYWIRPISSTLTYADVKFDNDYFASLALKGNYDSFNKAASSGRTRSPELTNVGSFEKCWKLKDGKWWMHKKATLPEMFSELFVYELGTALGMNMARYEKGTGCIKSLDFTSQGSVNFEPASAFMGDNEDYLDVIDALEGICPEAIPDYIKLIFMDTICANPDRHTNNFGLMRDVKNGKLLGLAPNYDNNMALISRGYPAKPNANDLLISLFRDVMDAYPEYKEYIPTVTEEIIDTVIQKINMKVKAKEIKNLVLARYKLAMQN